MAQNKLSLHPPRDNCSPQQRAFNEQVAYIINNYLRRENFVLVGNEQLELFADPSLIVEAVDGTPSYSHVSKIRFDEADGFVLSTPGSGIVRIDFTSPPPPPPFSGITVLDSTGTPTIYPVLNLSFQHTFFTVSAGPGVDTASVTLKNFASRIYTGNTDTVLSGSTGDELTEYLRAVTPLKIQGDTPTRTISIDPAGFGQSRDVVTNVCPEKMNLTVTGTVTIAAVPYNLVLECHLDASPSTGSVEVETGLTVEKRNITFLDGTTIGAPECTVDPDDCCDGCDCGCPDMETLEIGTRIINAPMFAGAGDPFAWFVAGVNGPGVDYLKYVVCPPTAGTYRLVFSGSVTPAWGFHDIRFGFARAYIGVGLECDDATPPGSYPISVTIGESDESNCVEFTTTENCQNVLIAIEGQIMDPDEVPTMTLTVEIASGSCP